jgi:divalent metal cation (Fe/Co/Zn/Cd) transporter
MADHQSGVSVTPQGQIRMIFALASLTGNLTVVRMLGDLRRGEVRLRVAWLFTRVDVPANLGLFASCVAVCSAEAQIAELLGGRAIGLYVAKEAAEVLRGAGQE